MNTPRIRLSRLTASADARAAQGNGAPPLPRPRERSPGGIPPSLSARARRIAKPLPAAGVVLSLIALLGYLGVYAASTKRTPVLVATHALSAGTVISESDVRTAKLAGEGSVLASLVPAGERSQVVGQRLSSAVPAGVPLPAGALAGRGTPASVLTLAVPEFDVTAENLQPGDRITILATYGAGSGAASTRPVARNLEVLSVGELPANAQASTTTIPVAVALGEPGSASQLVLAEEDGKIDVLLEGSGASTATIPQASQGSTP